METLSAIFRRQLIKYLPPYMQEYPEMQKIAEAEQPEVNELWDDVDLAFANQYIPDATEYGVSRWEEMLEISPKDTDTLDERKFRILTRLNQELPYTYRALEKALTNLCGKGNFEITMRPNDYYIEVLLALSNENNYADVEKLLNKMIPANMGKTVKIMFNSHAKLHKYRHKDLAKYTHAELKRKEDL